MAKPFVPVLPELPEYRTVAEREAENRDNPGSHATAEERKRVMKRACEYLASGKHDDKSARRLAKMIVYAGLNIQNRKARDTKKRELRILDESLTPHKYVVGFALNYARCGRSMPRVVRDTSLAPYAPAPAAITPVASVAERAHITRSLADQRMAEARANLERVTR